MTSITRTAYPQLTQQELDDNYTPTEAELTFVIHPGRGADARLAVLVLLKTFQCLGYFPALEVVPARIINHLRTALKHPGSDEIVVSPASLYRYHAATGKYLSIQRYSNGGRWLPHGRSDRPPRR